MIFDTFRIRKNLRLLIFVSLLGFLFPFFYQLLINHDLTKIELSVIFGQDSKPSAMGNILLLSGWKERKGQDLDSGIWSSGDSSAIAISLPKKAAYRFEIELYFIEDKPDSAGIRVYANKEHIINLSPVSSGTWHKYDFIVMDKFINQGFNKLNFFNLSGKKVGVGYRNMTISNYKKLPWVFPRGYVFFDPVRWIPLKEEISWTYCFFGALILPCLWVLWSLWLFSVSIRPLEKILSVSVFSYFPSIILFSFFYLFSRIFLMKFAIGISDFLILSLGVTGGCKAALAVVYANKENLRMQAESIKMVISKWQHSLVRFFSFVGDSNMLKLQPGLDKYASSLEKGASVLLAKGNILVRVFSYLFMKGFVLVRAFSYLLVIRISTLFILIFVALLFACAFLTIAGKGKLAEQAAIWAYIALIIGIFFKSVKMLFKERQ
jgi:hypothetical protein